MPSDWIDGLKMVRSLSLEVFMQRSERRFVLGDNVCISRVFVCLAYKRNLIAFVPKCFFWDVCIAIILKDRDTVFLWSGEQFWLLYNKKIQISSPVTQLILCVSITWPSLHCPMGNGAQGTRANVDTLATAVAVSSLSVIQ